MPVPEPEVLAVLLAPIPGAASAGRDLRYDPRYDAVREARREDADLPQGALATDRKIADWPRVLKDTATLLAAESKDLNLAAWYTEAQLKRAGIGGLAGGLTVIAGLLDQYWDGIFPELEDGDAELRLGPLEWVGSRLDLAVRQAPATEAGISYFDYQRSLAIPTDAEAKARDEKAKAREAALKDGRPSPEAVNAAIAASSKAYYKELVADFHAAFDALDALERVSDARFANDAPSYIGLRRALEEVQPFAANTLAKKLEADPDPVEEILADPDSDAVATDSASGAHANGAGGALAPEPVSPGDAAARVASVARYLRQQDPTAPASYLLVRGLRWGEIRTPAARLDPRLLEAPPAGARTRLKSLLIDGKWPELLEASEQVMATPAGRGWLDVQRYTLTAFARLGPSYDTAAHAVRAELAALLAAVPELPEMTLMDDLPTANGETLAWIADEELDMPMHENISSHDGADSPLPDGTAVFAAALDGEAEGDSLAARGSAARTGATGRRRSDRHVMTAGTDGADAFMLARAEVVRGRTNRAVEVLVAELDRERSARGRFVRQTQIAQVMVEAGLAEVAQPILERLVETITERSLEEWEAGPLVAQPLVLMCRVIDALSGNEKERDALYLRVCRLDPLQAIGLRRTT